MMKEDGHHALEAVADPQDDQRRDGDDGHGLQEDRVWIEAALDEARLGKQQGDQEAKGKTESKAQEGTQGRQQGSRQQARQVVGDGAGHE